MNWGFLPADYKSAGAGFGSKALVRKLWFKSSGTAASVHQLAGQELSNHSKKPGRQVIERLHGVLVTGVEVNRIAFI